MWQTHVSRVPIFARDSQCNTRQLNLYDRLKVGIITQIAPYLVGPHYLGFHKCHFQTICSFWILYPPHNIWEFFFISKNNTTYRNNRRSAGINQKELFFKESAPVDSDKQPKLLAFNI